MDNLIEDEDPTVLTLTCPSVEVVVSELTFETGVVEVPGLSTPFVISLDSSESTVVELPDEAEPSVVVFQPEEIKQVTVSPAEDPYILALPGGIKGDPGDSAYDQAVMMGFVGTLEEWLASLVGADGGAVEAQLSYTHIQSAPSSVWIIHHDLPFQPGGITTTDSAGSQLVGEITILDPNTIQINFSSGFSGIARLS